MLTRPGMLLRLEHAAMLAVVLFAYHYSGSSWWTFAVLFLWPDLGMLGYLANARLGAATYNVVHTSVLPIALAAFGYLSGRTSLIPFAFIWLAHIEFDRMLGYGLKYPTAFKETHLDRISGD